MLFLKASWFLPDSNSKESLQRVLLAEPYIGIAVTVINPDDYLADDGYDNPVSEEVLVRNFSTKLLRFYELMAKIHIIGFSRHSSPVANKALTSMELSLSAVLKS